MKEKFLKEEFYKSIDLLPELITKSIGFTQHVLDTKEGIGFLDLYGLISLITRRERTKLRKGIVEIEKEIFRLKILLKEIDSMDQNMELVKRMIDNREEGTWVKLIDRYKRKNLRILIDEQMKLLKGLNNIKKN